MSLLDVERRETPSLYKGMSVSLDYIEEAHESVSFLDIEERVSLLYIERTETPALYKGRSVSLLCREEADSFSMEKRECLSSI